MLDQISLDDLASVHGGNAASEKWSEIQTAAGPHCPKTVAAHPHAPKDREAAQAIGNACIAEMGSFKAGFGGGRAKINAGIDEAFPAK